MHIHTFGLTMYSPLQTIFGRPSLLGGLELMIGSEVDHILKINSELSHHLYGDGHSYQADKCPFDGAGALLLDRMEIHGAENPLMKETWLLLIPICVNHKQCIHCFQEADDSKSNGMRSLRGKIIDEASSLISNVHAVVRLGDGFIAPIVASTRVFIAGCAIVISIFKKWASAVSHIKDLAVCSEVLSMFAAHWGGGQSYLHVWRTVLDLLGCSQPS